MIDFLLSLAAAAAPVLSGAAVVVLVLICLGLIAEGIWGLWNIGR